MTNCAGEISYTLYTKLFHRGGGVSKVGVRDEKFKNFITLSILLILPMYHDAAAYFARPQANEKYLGGRKIPR